MPPYVDEHEMLYLLRYKQLNKKETPQMTYKYRLKHTISLEQVVSNYGSDYQELIASLYTNNTLLYCSDAPSIVNRQYYTGLWWEDAVGDKKSINLRSTHLELVETVLPEGMVWGRVRNQTTQFGDTHLLDQIRTRYAFFNRPTNGLSNIIIDNYAPKLMYTTKFDQAAVSRIANMPKTAYAISPWFAQYFGAQQVPPEQLCRILGYDVKRLKNLVTNVKRKSYSISFVGYGGTGVNTIHWLTQIMKITQSVNLFTHIDIMEPDTLEVSNLLRFPKNPYIENRVYESWHIRNTSKLRLLEPAELSLLSRTKPMIRANTIHGNNLCSDKGTEYDYEARRRLPKPRHVFYGAPTIDTRASFEGIGHFISATHNGNSAHLWLNPTQDSDLQVESYGLIELTPFFMNQLRLAIGLLETLASDDLDLKEPDKLLLEYSFDGEAKLPTNRTYNFQLGGHNGLVATETEAANDW